MLEKLRKKISNRKNDRDSNFELMRIVSMYLIVLGHTIIFGKMMEHTNRESVQLILRLILFFLIVHVNSFVLLTGYFQSNSKFKLKKLIYIIVEVIFYNFFIYIFFKKTFGVPKYNIIDYNNEFGFNSLGTFWYIKCYLYLYLLSDFLNNFINLLSKEKLEKFIKIGFILFSIIPFISNYVVFSNNGYTLVNFIYLYVVGAYLRKYNLKDSYHFKNMSLSKYRIILLIVFFACIYINFSSYIFSNSISNSSNFFNYISLIISGHYLDYSHPIIIIQSICYFEFFKTIKIKSRIINYLSKATLGVYLIHQNHFVKEKIYVMLGFNKDYVSYNKILVLFSSAFLIFIVCLFLDIVRIKIFDIFLTCYKKIKNR